jgi:hypothetical protein
MGWASGFQAGTQMAKSWLDTYREAEERRKLQEIEKAAPETGIGYTAEQGQELTNIANAINPETGRPYYEVQAQPGGLGYTVTPQFQYEGGPATPTPVETGIRPGLTTDFLGRRYAGQITPEQEAAGRMQAQADVVALRNPAEAQRMRLAARQEERAGEEFKTSQQLRGLQISKAEQEAADTERMNTAMTEINALGAPPTMDQIRTIAAKNNLNLDQQFRLGSNLTGIAEADAKLTVDSIKKKIRGQGLDGLLKLHKDDPTFDDNSFFEKSVGKDGRVTLTQKANDGTVLGTTTFKDQNEAVAYLSQAAVEPGNVYTWMLGNRAKQAQIAVDEARTDYLRSGGRQSTRPEVSNADLRAYIKDNQDNVVGKDPKTGKDILFRDLPEDEQRARAFRFYTGSSGGLMTGELPSDVVSKMKPPGQAGRAAAPKATSAAGPSSEEVNVMFNDARRGGDAGLRYLRDKLESNDFNLRQRLEAEQILGLR